jgi:hypothetical protein
MIKTYLLSLFSLLFIGNIFSQEKPINSNYLIERGISPRTLDAAASSFMQDGHFTEKVFILKKENDEETSYETVLIYDPSYNDGMDIRLVKPSKDLSKNELKQLKRYIEKSHYFSRMSRNYLYDEKTLKLTRSEGDTMVLEFFYQKKDIDPYLQYIKRIKGRIFLVNDKLDRVILSNFKPLKNKISSYKKEVKFSKTDKGGYIITKMTESYVIEKGKTKKDITIIKNIQNYTDENGKVLSWEGMTETKPVTYDQNDLIDVKLGGTLPFLGKEARKLGYQIPRPYGVATFVYIHDQAMEFTGLQVGMEGSDMIDLENLFMLNDSEVNQSTFMPLFKGDVWIFPFLNIMAIAGVGQNKLDGELVINENLRDFLNGLPDWIDVPNIPYSIPIKTNITSEVYGGGITLAGGISDFNVSINYQLMFTRIVEANTTNMVNVITPMFGYMSPFGINFMIGGQGQFYNTKISGFIELEDQDGTMHKLNYNVDFEPIKWNAIVGVYKIYNNHWEMSLQAGFGQRSSLTGILGYRF